MDPRLFIDVTGEIGEAGAAEVSHLGSATLKKYVTTHLNIRCEIAIIQIYII